MNIKLRLQKALLEKIKLEKLEYTQAEIIKNIENFGVYINSILQFKRLFWVYPQDHIDINHWPKREKIDYSDLQILVKNNVFWLLFKPSGVVIHSGAGHKHDNLADWLIQKYPEFKQQKWFDASLGFVNRLDKPTAGLVLWATSPENKIMLQNLFRSRQVFKEYLAIVSLANLQTNNLLEIQNYLEKITGKYTFYQTRNQKTPTRQILFFDQNQAQKYDKNYKQSSLSIRFLAFDQNQALAVIRLYSGRMHQIRLFTESIALPVLNDKQYTKKIETKGFLEKLKFLEKIETKESIENATSNIITTEDLWDYIKTQGLKYFSKDKLCLLSNKIAFEYFFANQKCKFEYGLFTKY